MNTYSILRQIDASPAETSLARLHAMTSDVVLASTHFDRLDEHAAALRQGTVLPIGSVEFVRKAMELVGIEEPRNLSYPEPLQPYLRREVRQCAAGSFIGRWFVKPVKTKAFTGFVVDILGDPEQLDPDERAQYEAFLCLAPDAQVWLGEPVRWLTEVRYYVVDGEIRGEGRYDDGPEDWPAPDRNLVSRMAAEMARSSGGPVAFSLDVGVLEGGETALVECNDAWALGYYKGTLSRADYIEMLWRRWAQLASGAISAPCRESASR